MSYITKLEAAQAELKRTGIWKLNSSPPIFSLSRKIGLKIRPCHYNTFFMNVLIASVWFGCTWGALMWFTVWSSQQMPIFSALIASILTGLLFGLFMAMYYKWSASKNGLSSWSDF